MSRGRSNENYLAGGLSFMVHLVLLVLLAVGLSWKQLPEMPVNAELWQDLPAPERRPVPVKPKVKAPQPKPKAPPKPKALPKPKAPPKPKRADIALKAKKAALKRKLEREKEAAKRLAEEKKQLELRQKRLAAEREAAEKEKLARKKQLDALLATQMSQELNRESQRIKRQAAALASAQAKILAEYKNRIREQIRNQLRLPGNLKGNPEAVYQVDLLPNGDLEHLTQIRSSGQPTYDDAVERAIRKACPLPLPPRNPELADEIRFHLELKFRPYDQ